MQTVGKILHLYTSEKGDVKRTSKTALQIDINGIIGDKFYNKNSNRSILIASQNSYQIALDEGIAMPDGYLGENICVDYNPYHMQQGDQFMLGDVTFEITQNCTMCNSLATIDDSLPELLENDRGIFAKALTSGTIHLDDTFKLIST